MSARKEIRSLTYSNLIIETEYSNSKWKPTNDDVFNKLGELFNEEEQIKIADFLNLFYYFIICYSKKCFKKYGIWQSSKIQMHRTNKYRLLSHEEIRFNYQLANENNSHGKLLAIQKQMHHYRQEYKNAIDNDKVYYTEEKIGEIMSFINESLHIICNCIQEPVLFTCYDIKQKIAKYNETFNIRKKHKKSHKVNYAVLEALGLNINK
jgi:hypothetical protein